MRSRKQASPLALLMAGLSASLACHPEMIPASTNPNLYQNSRATDDAIVQTVASYAVVFGIARCHRMNIPFTPPSLDNTFYENLFIMAGLVDSSTGRPDPVILSVFRRFGSGNVDHGMALCVFSALVTASSRTDPISCFITTIGAAYGPLHFGATLSAQRALQEIGTPDNVPSFLEEVKQGKRKLFGYGHRAYKWMDPRVQLIRGLLQDLNLDPEKSPLLNITQRIEQLASKDEYFQRRRLYPNADLYGHFVFSAWYVTPMCVE